MSFAVKSLLPALPEAWIVTPLRYASTCLDGQRVPLNEDERSQRRGEYPYWGANGVVDRVNEYIFDEPLVLLGEDGAPFFDKSKSVAFFVTGKIWVNNHIHVLRISPEFDPRFVMYCLNATDYGPWIEGSTRDKLTQDNMGSILLPKPPTDEQQAIVNYLDNESARIDALLAVKERVLELVREKRKAFISRAVTVGTDSEAALKDCGISWLGRIPSHWKTSRLAWLFRERDERGDPSLPLLEVSISRGVILREFSDERIESTAADFNTYKIARKDDVVFNKMRMWQGAVGVAPQDGLVSPDYVVACPTGELSSEFAGLLFRTEAFSAECARRSHGIVWDRLRLYWEGFREIEVPLPSPEVQSRICEYVAEKAAKLDSLRASTEETIALLKERRAALISGVVTGQIEPKTKQ